LRSAAAQHPPTRGARRLADLVGAKPATESTTSRPRRNKRKALPHDEAPTPASAVRGGRKPKVAKPAAAVPPLPRVQHTFGSPTCPVCGNELSRKLPFALIKSHLTRCNPLFFADAPSSALRAFEQSWRLIQQAMEGSSECPPLPFNARIHTAFVAPPRPVLTGSNILRPTPKKSRVALE
jgi:hypothetical protein